MIAHMKRMLVMVMMTQLRLLALRRALVVRKKHLELT